MTDEELECELIAAKCLKDGGWVGAEYYETALLALKSARAENVSLRTLVKDLRTNLKLSHDMMEMAKSPLGETVFSKLLRWLDEHEPKGETT